MTSESPAGSVAVGRAAQPLTDAQAWVARLRGPGAERDTAIKELHALLLRAARFEVNRRSAIFPQLGGADLNDLASQSADDALMSVLRRLDDFRGDSRFTTWASKFAILEASVKVRRHAWRGREIPIALPSWLAIADEAPGPDQHAEARDLLGALAEEVERLTGKQREVLVAIAINEVPLDVLAERLQTSRGALYKVLHDARRKLRAGLAERGLGPDARSEDNREHAR